MNKFIKEQLQKAQVDLSSVTDNGDHYVLHIPKETPETAIINPLDFTVGGCYNIEVERYIIHPYEGFNLHDNWNNGVIPTDTQMNCEVNQIMGKMIKIKAVGANDNKPWEGWLPKKSCKIKYLL